jgi:hypothetical protein
MVQVPADEGLDLPQGCEGCLRLFTSRLQPVATSAVHLRGAEAQFPADLMECSLQTLRVASLPHLTFHDLRGSTVVRPALAGLNGAGDRPRSCTEK